MDQARPALGPDEKPTCKMCMFFEPGEINRNDVTDKKYYCHRHPPKSLVIPGPLSPNGQMSIQITSVFPMTDTQSWCGEWDDGSEDDDDPDDIDPVEVDPEPEVKT